VQNHVNKVSTYTFEDGITIGSSAKANFALEFCEDSDIDL